MSYNYMSIYIGNDLEDRLEALEVENASLRKYNEYHQVVHEINHMSDLHVDSSFYRQSMKLDNYVKINKWIDFSIGQSTVLQQLNKKRPKLSNSNQTKNRRRYVNFENGSHFICSFNLNNPESTVCIAFRLNSIASGNNLLLTLFSMGGGIMAPPNSFSLISPERLEIRPSNFLTFSFYLLAIRKI